MTAVWEGVRLASLLAFVALGMVVAQSRGEKRRRVINVFLVYVLALSALGACQG